MSSIISSRIEVAIGPAVYSCAVSDLGVKTKVRPGLGIRVGVCFLSECQRSKTACRTNRHVVVE